MELYIFDEELNFQGLTDKYFSLRWTRRYHKTGEFELHCALTAENLSLLQRGNIVWKPGDREAGYISCRNLKQDESGQEVLTVKGNFLTGYLGRRIIWGTENLNTTAELGMRGLVENNAITVDPDRKIPLLELAPLKGFSDEYYYLSMYYPYWEAVPLDLPVVFYQVSYKNLLEELENLSNLSGLGYRVIPNFASRRLLFDVYQGVNRIVEQCENPPVIFSNEFDNVFEQEYIDGINNYRNIALVAGEGEGQDRQLVTVGGGAGLDRYELYVDARDLQSSQHVDGEEIPIPPEQYQEMLVKRGETKLAECSELQTFDSKINVRGNLRYKRDFDLGDVVTVTNKNWGVTVNTRITEIEEVYEFGKQEVYCMFGNSVPTLVDKIRQAVR